jgi:WD40 repeat protein
MRHLGPVYAASFSDDGDSITTGGFDRTCRFWATSNGRRFGPPIVFPSAVRVVAPVPMFRSVAGSDDGLFRYDDFLELFQMSRFSRVARSLEHLVVHPSGSFLVCVTGRSPPLGFSEHQAIMLDLRCSDCELAPDRISPLRIPHPDAVNWADISADGETIVTGCADGGVYLWNRASGRRVAHGKAHDRPVDKVSFGPRGNQVLSLAFGDHPVLWEGENMAVRKVLRHDQLVCDADWSSDGARVITLAFNGDLHVIDAESGELCSSRTSEHPGYPCVLCRGPGDLFAAAHGPGVVSVVQLTDDRLIDICEIVINQTVTTMSFSPTGDRLAIGTRERIARIWRVPSGEALTPPLEHLDRVNQVSFSPDGLLLATACGGPDRGAEGESRLWDARDGEPVSPWRHHGEDVMRAVFHPSGDRLLTTCWNGQIEFIPVQPRIPRDELLALCHIVSSRQPDDRGEAIVLTHDDYKRYWQIVVDGKTSRFRERANRR